MRPFLALSFPLLLALPLHVQDNPIVQRINAFIAAYNAGAVAEFYTEDGALLPPRANPVVGREAIAAHDATAFAQVVGNLRYTIPEIRGHGDAAAVEIGETRIKAGQQAIRGRSLHVWVRTQAGRMLSRDIYHVLSVE